MLRGSTPFPVAVERTSGRRTDP